MSLRLTPASNGGLPFSTPPVASSVLIELTKIHPSLTFLPQSDRSCQYGGTSRANEAASSTAPLARSNFQNVISPRYSSLYFSIGAYRWPSGTAYCDPSIT